jgi:hypothetical protein
MRIQQAFRGKRQHLNRFNRLIINLFYAPDKIANFTVVAEHPKRSFVW